MSDTLRAEEISNICSPLCDNPDLVLPARLSQTPATAIERHEYLSALLRHDPGVFLERHGKHMSAKQRAYFEPLRGDYEVDFYLKLLEEGDKAPIKQEGSSVSSTAKNRRLAKMNRLTKEGFFEEEAARKRAPLLHHQYLGKYTGPSRPGERSNLLHERIFQQHEEMELLHKMAHQKEKEVAASQAFEATLSESEDESDEELDSRPGSQDGSNTQQPDSARGPPPPDPISSEELEQNRQEFQALMKARFLGGEDGGAEADADTTLDDDWAKEVAQDLEDKYFET